jgi:hypothetical protein
MRQKKCEFMALIWTFFFAEGSKFYRPFCSFPYAAPKGKNDSPLR